MSEFEDKLGAILSDSNAMSQIMALAQSLGGGTPAPEEPVPAPPPAVVPAPPPDLSGLLGSLDPQTLQTGMQLFSEFSNGEDQRTALLLALKPFLKEERSAKIDRAVQIARLSRILRVAFRLFRGKEEENV